MGKMDGLAISSVSSDALAPVIDRVLAAFVMGRPDDERDAAQSWIRERAQVSADALKDEARPIADARKG